MKIDSKGFRDEDGNPITIPGDSVKYDQVQAGHLAQFGQDGKIEDGGAKDQFAAANHTHNSIGGEFVYGHTAAIAQVEAFKSDDNKAHVSIVLKNDKRMNGEPKTVDINTENADNLKRALLPAAPPAPNGTSPITNGQVYDALQELQTALPVVYLNSSIQYGQYGWSVVNSGDALNLLSVNNKFVMVEVRCSVEVEANETVNFRSIGNLFANEDTQARDIEVGLVVDGRMFIFVPNVKDWRDLDGGYYDDDIQDCTLTSINLYPSN